MESKENIRSHFMMTYFQPIDTLKRTKAFNKGNEVQPPHESATKVSFPTLCERHAPNTVTGSAAHRPSDIRFMAPSTNPKEKLNGSVQLK